MMDLLNIVYQYKRGRASGSIHALMAFVLFIVFFKPIVWVLKITGLFALLQFVGLINEQGYFSFEAALGLLVLILVVSFVLKISWSIFFGLSNFLLSRSGKGSKKLTNINH